MQIVVFAGGIGGARFLTGLRAAVDSSTSITAIVNTGDDIILHGLRICPDLDTVMYTLGNGIDRERGWGRQNETWSAREELANYLGEEFWFGLGDRDIATHLIRTELLAAGHPLSAVTKRLCERWKPGIQILPMSNQDIQTHVIVDDDGTDRSMHFQEWWIRHRAALAAKEFQFRGINHALPAPGVIHSISQAGMVIFAPSNPVVSIGPILAVPGIREAVQKTPAQVIGLSPIIGGAPVRGMADACLTAIGVETSAEAVARHYGSRKETGVLDGWLVDPTDEHTIVPGVVVRPVPLWMSDIERTIAMANDAMELAHDLKLDCK